MLQRTYKRPPLNREDAELILDLLESERADLPPEIRRTHSPTYRDRLRRRLEQVDRLLSVIQGSLCPTERRVSSARAKLGRILRTRARAKARRAGRNWNGVAG